MVKLVTENFLLLTSFNRVRHVVCNTLPSLLCLSVCVFTFLLHSATNFCSSFDLVETFKTVGELADFSSTEHFTWSFSCDFWEVVSRPLKARTSSWECLCFCCSPSNFVCVKLFSACNVFICSWTLQSWELS